MRKSLVVLLCGSVLALCSGCGTIVGGIIGYQSGELAAGLAIGATIDFGDDLAHGIGEILADPAKEFAKNTEFNAEAGTINLPSVAFTPDRMQKVKAQLKETFEHNDWPYNVVNKTSKSGLFTKDWFRETWECKTNTEDEFELQFYVKHGHDAQLTLTIPKESKADLAKVTSQIYDWLKTICVDNS